MTPLKLYQKTDAMLNRIEGSFIENGCSSRTEISHPLPKIFRYPQSWELVDLLKEVKKILDPTPPIGRAERFGNTAGTKDHGYTKDQHITDLQTRNTELVEKNRELKNMLDMMAGNNT